MTPQRVVLFVCTGNICRSPMAESLAIDLADREKPGLGSPSVIRIQSAGTSALGGIRPTWETRRVLEARGLRAAGRSTRLTRKMIEEADLVYGMTPRHVRYVNQTAAAKGPVATLRTDGRAIDDPYGRTMAFYRFTLSQIEVAVKDRMEDILTKVD